MGRYVGLGRGLTAPSWAASYHGPMPTLSTCPSWNKDGLGGIRGVILVGLRKGILLCNGVCAYGDRIAKGAHHPTLGSMRCKSRRKKII